MQSLSETVNFIPKRIEDQKFDTALSRVAVKLAVKRHAGYITEITLPSGVSYIQTGKDLQNIKTIIGTGGGIACVEDPYRVLSEALFNPQESLSLRPKNPRLYLDNEYIMWAMGLLVEVFPNTAYSLLKQSINPINKNVDE